MMDWKRKLLLTANITGLILVIVIGLTGVMGYSSLVGNLTKSVMAHSASGGEFGGSDGPTAVFLSGDYDLCTVAIVLLLSLVLIGFLFVVNIVWFVRNR